jgi:hypothetical protein
MCAGDQRGGENGEKAEAKTVRSGTFPGNATSGGIDDSVGLHPEAEQRLISAGTQGRGVACMRE